MGYKIENWRHSISRTKTSKWKQFFYHFYRPLNSFRLRPILSDTFLNVYKPEIIFCKRGFPLERRRAWATNFKKIEGKVIVVQGTGTGWDVISWAKLLPKKIYAVDLFSFEQSWKDITNYCKEKYEVEVCFHKGSLDDLKFLENDSIDLCASDAVFEHCRNLEQVIKESYRVLTKGGYLYASYGPMWYCAAGDHFSGKYHLRNAFNHVCLDEEDYKIYLEKTREVKEDFQSGYRYVEIGLFSYLSSDQYIELYAAAGFNLDSICIELSDKSLKFKDKYPDEFSSITKKYKNRCTEDDFIIKAHLVRLKK